MKRFKDLELLGSDRDLVSLVDAISESLPRKWKRDREAETRQKDLAPDYPGFAFERAEDKTIPAAGLFLFKSAGKLEVVNIVPAQIGELSFDQYNAILDEFAKVVREVMPSDNSIKLKVTDEIAKITEEISVEADNHRNLSSTFTYVVGLGPSKETSIYYFE